VQTGHVLQLAVCVQGHEARNVIGKRLGSIDSFLRHIADDKPGRSSSGDRRTVWTAPDQATQKVLTFQTRSGPTMVDDLAALDGHVHMVKHPVPAIADAQIPHVGSGSCRDLVLTGQGKAPALRPQCFRSRKPAARATDPEVPFAGFGLGFPAPTPIFRQIRNAGAWSHWDASRAI